MKRGLIILGFALLAGVAAFGWMRFHKMAEPHEALLDELPELGWVKSELKLSDEQFAKVRELHVAYRPQCVKMCDRIRGAHERLEAAAEGQDRVTADLKAAIEEHARIHAECQEAMIEHLYRTAAALDEEQARRYLDTMLPYALDFRHSEPEGVHVH